MILEWLGLFGIYVFYNCQLDVGHRVGSHLNFTWIIMCMHMVNTFLVMFLISRLQDMCIVCGELGTYMVFVLRSYRLYVGLVILMSAGWVVSGPV